MLTVDYEKCTGCGACVQRCPKRCISWTEREFGFRYPQIDKDACVNCGQCWNWQTGTFEGRVSLTYGFKSRLPHQVRKLANPLFTRVCEFFVL